MAIHKSGNIRGDKVKYPDGIGCCIWHPFPDDENTGVCWDFEFEDIDDIINLLITLKEAEPEIYKETE